MWHIAYNWKICEIANVLVYLFGKAISHFTAAACVPTSCVKCRRSFFFIKSFATFGCWSNQSTKAKGTPISGKSFVSNAPITMKTFLSICTLAALLGISPEVFAQTKSPKTEQDTITMLCHKWQPISMKVNDKSVPLEKEDSLLYIIFNKDGTFIDYFEGDSPTNKWTYDHKTKMIKMANAIRLVAIDDKYLVVLTRERGEITKLTLKKVD